MAIQILQGIQITPRGTYNTNRFSSSMVGGVWPVSFAFGAYIYNSSVDIGFSESPTKIQLKLVLEVLNRNQQYAYFDIQDSDLKCDAGSGGDENLYDINLNGVLFQDFILYNYEISIEKDMKILTVEFRDYSVVLDKIYIGLIKRQGHQFIHTSQANIEYSVVCSDCLLAGDSLNFMGFDTRNMDYGSYVGINGKVLDNFANLDDTGNVYSNWSWFFSQQPDAIKFDLNGGFLMIGTEEATEQRCGDFAPVSYNFNELLASLRFRGLNFTGAFPVAQTDADYIYHNNYTGPLRQVLSQFASDLGYSFYCQGKNFVGINLNKAIDISQVVAIADPTTPLGANFALNQDTTIISYKTSTTLDNTFRQAVITQSNRPREEKTDSKSPKRYVGYLPLHPIDLNRHNRNPMLRLDAYGAPFPDIQWTNNFEPTLQNNDRYQVLPELDGRMYWEIDASICLSHYDDALRDIFVQDRAIYGETQEIQTANFMALGMVPLVELTGDDKSMVIEKLVRGGGDEISNICLDKRFYKVYLGYYYSQFKEQVVQWEKLAADSMYKYGIVTKGLLDWYPYMPANSLSDQSPTGGFYGANGTSLLRIQHNIEPSAQEYYSLRLAPFKDLVLYSGQLTPSQYALPLQPTPASFYPIFPTGLFYGELSNDWGTTQEIFQRTFMMNLIDPCVQEFGNLPTTTDIQNNVSKKYEDWRLDYFRPMADPNIEEFYNYTQAFQNLQEQADGFATDMDRTVNFYYDFHYLQNRQCSKLHMMVLTDTRQHPNIEVNFTPLGTEFMNPITLMMYVDKEREAIKRRIQTQTISTCEISILNQMCKNIINAQYQLGPTGNPRFGCIIDEDKYNFLEEGFTYDFLTSANSRALNVQIVKNPIRNTDQDLLLQTFQGADLNGDFYYSDVINQFLQYQSTQASINLIYPVSPGANADYRGILTSQVDVENRSPEIVDIYGSPVNQTNNNTTTFKVINNIVAPDLQIQIDPFQQRFIPYFTVLTGNGNIITTVQNYHNYLVNLNNYALTSPMKSVSLVLAGGPSNFGNFSGYLSPNSGLQRMSMSVGDQGFLCSLEFSDRPKILPKQETIINAIAGRVVLTKN